MHGGRRATIQDATGHSSDGIQPHPNLDPASSGRFAFRRILESSVQALPDLAEALGKIRPTPERYRVLRVGKAAPVRFLNTLTDETLLSDKRFSDPFFEPGQPVITGVVGGGGERAVD